MSYDADEALPPQLILNALRRVIASPYFVNSERKRRFLEYIVQETLAGRADRIKEYTVAVGVFDRDPNFNPMTDPVVRIEAGRLRRCLEHYSLAEGAADRVWITVPKGGYVPRFVVTKGAASSIPKALGISTGWLQDNWSISMRRKRLLTRPLRWRFLRGCPWRRRARAFHRGHAFGRVSCPCRSCCLSPYGAGLFCSRCGFPGTGGQPPGRARDS
jgi:hypothetical protein